jgi:hypothetical protein
VRARIIHFFPVLCSIYSYYPLYPPVEEVNMDYEKFQCYGQMPLTPDVLIVPSELRFFIKVNNIAGSHSGNTLSLLLVLSLSHTNIYNEAKTYIYIYIFFTGCDWLRVCQSWAPDQGPGGRDLWQAAHPEERPIDRWKESQSLCGWPSGQDLI